MKAVCRIVFVAVLSIAAAGCETIDPDGTMGSVTESLGCWAVARLSGDGKDEAAIAGSVCVVAGYEVANRLEVQRKQFPSDEQFYNSELSSLSDYATGLERNIQRARGTLEQEEAEIERLTGEFSTSQLDVELVQELRGIVEDRKVALEEQLVEAEDRKKYQRGLLVHMEHTDSDNTSVASKLMLRLNTSVNALKRLVSEQDPSS